MSQHIRFGVLVLGALLLLFMVYTTYEYHFAAWTIWFKTQVVMTVKLLLLKSTWQKVPLFIGNFISRAGFKFLAFKLPQKFFISVALMVGLSPSARRRLRVWFYKTKRRVRRAYKWARSYFDSFFGVHGALAFMLAAVVAIAAFVLSASYLPFDLFVWVGSWGPIGVLFRGLADLLRWMLGGIWIRLPFTGTLTLLAAEAWRRHIVPRFPALARRQRTFVWAALRQARRSRIATSAARRRLRAQAEERRLLYAYRAIVAPRARSLWGRRFYLTATQDVLSTPYREDSSSRYECRETYQKPRG